MCDGVDDGPAIQWSEENSVMREKVYVALSSVSFVEDNHDVMAWKRRRERGAAVPGGEGSVVAV